MNSKINYVQPLVNNNIVNLLGNLSLHVNSDHVALVIITVVKTKLLKLLTQRMNYILFGITIPFALPTPVGLVKEIVFALFTFVTLSHVC